MKSSFRSESTKRPSPSVTVAVTFTSSIPLVKRATSWSCPAGTAPSESAVTMARAVVRAGPENGGVPGDAMGESVHCHDRQKPCLSMVAGKGRDLDTARTDVQIIGRPRLL